VAAASKSSELEERAGHATDPRFLCPTGIFTTVHPSGFRRRIDTATTLDDLFVEP
jgi:hypothetical protein